MDFPSTASLAPPARSRFQTTQWGRIRAAGHGTVEERAAALAELCERYWQPLYLWMRAKGHSREDARDGVQGFFERFLGKNCVALAEESKGRFRTFLLTCLRNHLEGERQSQAAAKRGGGATHLSWDWEGVEGLLAPEGETSVPDPVMLYDRHWALAILGQAEEALRADFERRGKAEVFESLLPYLDDLGHGARDGRGGTGYAAAAARAGMSEPTFRVALHRLRRRYGQLVVETVRETVDGEESLADELASLHQALRADHLP